MAVWNQSHRDAVDGSLDHYGYGQPRQSVRRKFIQLCHVLWTNLDTRSVRVAATLLRVNAKDGCQISIPTT